MPRKSCEHLNEQIDMSDQAIHCKDCGEFISAVAARMPGQGYVPLRRHREGVKSVVLVNRYTGKTISEEQLEQQS